MSDPIFADIEIIGAAIWRSPPQAAGWLARCGGDRAPLALRALAWAHGELIAARRPIAGADSMVELGELLCSPGSWGRFTGVAAGDQSIRDACAREPGPSPLAIAAAAPAEIGAHELEAALCRLAALALRADGEHVDAGPPTGGNPLASELGLAQRLIAGGLDRELRWMHDGPAPGWRQWSGTHWQPVAERLIPAPIIRGVHRIVGDLLASGMAPATAARLESRSGMQGVAALAASDPQMAMPSPTDPPGLLATPTGVLNLNTGEALPHDPARAITRCCAVAPGDEAHPLWRLVDDHLRACLGAGYVAAHRFLGSALLGRGPDRRLLWLHGPGGDGKSTLVAVLRHALGSYFAAVPAEFLLSSGGRGAHVHELGRGLPGSRIAAALEAGGSLDWEKIKGLSSGIDVQVTKGLYGRAFSYDRPPCLVVVSNAEPKPPDRASADRLIVGGLVPPVEPDPELARVLAEGGPDRDALAGAALAWLIRGCADFLAHGLGPVPIYGGALSSTLARWIEAGGARVGDGWASLPEIREALGEWCRAEGDPVPQDREITAALRAVAQAKRTNAGYRYGIRVRGVGVHG